VTSTKGGKMLAELLFPRRSKRPRNMERTGLLASWPLKAVWDDGSAGGQVSKSFGAALFYGLTSISLNFINKAVLNGFDFNFPFTIMTFQMATTLVIFGALRALNLAPSSQRCPWQERRDFLGASLAFALHSALSLYALHGMNIPMYGAIKRCTPIVSLVMSVFILKKAAPSKKVVLSVLVISCGIILASVGDLEFEWRAYTMGLLSVFAQGSYLTLVQKASMERKRSAFEMVYTNSFNTLPLFALASIAFGEPLNAIKSEALSKAGFYPTFLMLVVSANLLTYSQFLCTSVCSALTTSLVGVGKSVVQTIIGFFVFGGVRYHPLNVAGLCLNLMGGALYSHAKLQETNSKVRESDQESADGSLLGNSSDNDVTGDSKQCFSDSVAIPVEDLMTSRVVKVRSDIDHDSDPRKVM